MPPERGLRCVDTSTGKPQPVRPELGVEPSSTIPGCTTTSRTCNIELDDAVQIFRVVDDQRRADGLAALGSARPARQDRHARLHGDLQRDAGGFLGARYDHAHRLDLVDRRVGAVAPAAESIEQHLAVDLGAQAPLERRGGAPCGARMKLNRYCRGVH